MKSQILGNSNFLDFQVAQRAERYIRLVLAELPSLVLAWEKTDFEAMLLTSLVKLEFTRYGQIHCFVLKDQYLFIYPLLLVVQSVKKLLQTI